MLVHIPTYGYRQMLNKTDKFIVFTLIIHWATVIPKLTQAICELDEQMLRTGIVLFPLVLPC